MYSINFGFQVNHFEIILITVLSEYCRAVPVANSNIPRRRLTFAGSTAEVQKAVATAVIASDHQNGADSNNHHYNHHIIVTTTAQ